MIDRLQQNVLKTLQVYCIYSGTVVPAQYGGLCCLFAPVVLVFWLTAIRPHFSRCT